MVPLIIMVLGVTTVATGLLAVDWARAIITWWTQLGPLVFRLTASAALALGGFVAYACAPGKRKA